jgi:hypothetical protein
MEEKEILADVRSSPIGKSEVLHTFDSPANAALIVDATSALSALSIG